MEGKKANDFLFDELKHHSRVIDMMLTMHSILRDRYYKLALSVDILSLFASTILCATVLLDPEILKIFRIDRQVARIVIGLCSIIVFFLSLLSLRVDWKQTAEKHGQAAITLSKLKSQCRALSKLETQPDPQSIKEQCLRCAETLSELPIKIPDHKFAQLKMLHKRKVALSKMIDQYPGSSLFLLRLLMWFRHSKCLISRFNGWEEDDKQFRA